MKIVFETSGAIATEFFEIDMCVHKDMQPVTITINGTYVNLPKKVEIEQEDEKGRVASRYDTDCLQLIHGAAIARGQGWTLRIEKKTVDTDMGGD